MNRSTGFILVLLGILTYFSWLLITPFLGYILGAILIAFILYPLQRRLERKLSAGKAAMILLLVAIIGFILPFVVVGIVVARDAAALLEEIDPDEIGITPVEEFIEDTTGFELDLGQHLTDAAEQAGSILIDQTFAWLGTITHALVGFGLVIFLIYYLLKDGQDLVAWIRERTPLPDEVQEELVMELREITRAVLAGHVLIAIIEGTIAGLGLFATGIPNATFWTFVMVILSLIPLIGAFLVWGPAVGYLILTGEPVLAAALAIYSAVVVGVADDYLRPIVVDRYAELSPAIIILGVVGGVYAFGVIGLFFGPVLLGVFIAVITVYDEQYERISSGRQSG